MTKTIIPTDADDKMIACLKEKQSFSMIAGAGSGKTTSLITALGYINDNFGRELAQSGQQVVCITYTKRGVAVISEKLKFDDLFLVSTLHKFLWDVIKRFNTEVRKTLIEYLIPKHIEKAKEKDRGGMSKTVLKLREKIAKLESDLVKVSSVQKFKYDDTDFSDYENGILNHDDVIDTAAYMISSNPTLRKILGYKYPYIFVDEAQDTFENVVEALNSVCAEEGLPMIGYFGDPMQQIYDKRAGDFVGPAGSPVIKKEENFRSSESVIDLINAIRTDVKQFPAGRNKGVEGSVHLVLAKAESPELSGGKKYSNEQIDRAVIKFDSALKKWNWTDSKEVKHLYLVRRMIARRLKFSNLHRLFTGDYASSKAQENYEKGEHFALKPLLKTICPLIECLNKNDLHGALDILRKTSPAFDIEGEAKDRSLKEMIDHAKILLNNLKKVWDEKDIRSLYVFAQKMKLCSFSDNLILNLNRPLRTEEFDKDNDDHSREKGEWLCDAFFKMSTSELVNYYNFTIEKTALSTQHGVKGEEYKNVLVVFDDVEASWSNYNFGKTLTPNTAGEAKETVQERTKKLIYVCFSRAEENLRILFFIENPIQAKKELVQKKLFKEDQVEII